MLENLKKARDAGGDHANPFATPKTVGWKPSCKCNAARVPAVVVDIFGGAGTVGLVAAQLGRDFVLIELSGKYAREIAEPRIAPEIKQKKLL